MLTDHSARNRPEKCFVLAGIEVSRDPITGLICPCEFCPYRMNIFDGGCPGWSELPESEKKEHHP